MNRPPNSDNLIALKSANAAIQKKRLPTNSLFSITCWFYFQSAYNMSFVSFSRPQHLPPLYYYVGTSLF